MSWWTGRRLAVALLSSAALNLFLAGVLVAVLIFDPVGEQRGRYAFREAAHSLSYDARQQVRDVWRGHRGEMRPRFQALREARGRLADLLARDGPVDERALEAAFREVEARSAEVQAGLHGLMMEMARRLPPPERARFFDRAMRHGHHGRHHRGWRHH